MLMIMDFPYKRIMSEYERIYFSITYIYSVTWKKYINKEFLFLQILVEVMSIKITVARRIKQIQYW